MPELQIERLRVAVTWLIENGHAVVEQDVAGLFRVDGGTELTINQVIDVAERLKLEKANA